MVAADPFAVAQQLGRGPDPFALAAMLDVPAPEASVSHVNLGRNRSAVANFWGGEKFAGGFGLTQLHIPDYWTLRQRSSQLFNDNLYARGLIRRLVTNEINTGLKLQAEPNDELIEVLTEEQAEEWAENVENRHEIWSSIPALCDFEGRRTIPQLQEEVRRESLIEGDILVHLRTDRRTGLPQIQLIRGGRVMTPLDRPSNDPRRIVNGVEIDDRNRQIAFHVRSQSIGFFPSTISLTESVRIPAFGSRSGKRIAWLVYGSDKRMDAIRGMPLLGLVLQSLKEIDRYRDSEQRAAVVNSILAMFIQKNEDKLGTRPMSGGAIRRTVVTGEDTSGAVQREFNIAESIPGVVFEELQQGEIPQSFDTKRPNVNFGVFEAAVIQAIAWANEVPPEILTLAFSNNYSASKAAINEFKAYLSRVRADFGTTFCQPIYAEWLIAEVIADRIDTPGLLVSRRDPLAYAETGAWFRAVWAGPVKPSVDLGKDVKAYRAAIEANLISATRASEDLFGVRFSTVLKRRTREMRAVREMNEELGISNEPQLQAPELSAGTVDNIIEAVGDRVMEEISDAESNRTTH